MESPLRLPASPGTPLFALSPERANRQALPQSPSLPTDMSGRLRDDPFFTSPSRRSDVADKVLQFNNMNKGKQYKDNDAALRRAVIGREEAEGETKRLREENNAFRKQLEAGKARELKVAQRLESVMEEMQRIQEGSEHKQAVYEKEVRRARKEAFKASSTLVKTQEELKTARNRGTLMREEAEMHKRKVEIREKEIFDAQYQQVAIQEKLDEFKQKLKLVEEERNALKNSLKEEEIARIAAEGRIPLPCSTPDPEFASPKKSKFTRPVSRPASRAAVEKPRSRPASRNYNERPKPRPVSRHQAEHPISSPRGGRGYERSRSQPPNRQDNDLQKSRSMSRMEGETPQAHDKSVPYENVEDPVRANYLQFFGGERGLLEEELRIHKRLLKDARDQIRYMNVECQLKQCSCHLAEANGEAYDFVPSFGQMIKDASLSFGLPLVKAERNEQVNTREETEELQEQVPCKRSSGGHKVEQVVPEVGTGHNDHSEPSADAVLEEEVKPVEEILFSPETGTFRRISSISQPLPPSPGPQSPAPAVSDIPIIQSPQPEPSQLAIPLAPVVFSASASILSLGDGFRPSDQIPRTSDECVVFPDDSAPPTPKAQPLEEHENKVHTPEASPVGASMDFPPTPGADLTFTAPINFTMPAHLLQRNAAVTPVPEPVSETVTDTAQEIQEQQTLPPTTPYINQAIASPFIAPATSDARSNMQPHSQPTPDSHPAPSRLVNHRPSTSMSSYPSHHDRRDYNDYDTNHSASTRLVETHSTTTIPLADERSSTTQRFPYSPGATKTKEEALANIARWRKGRAKSVTDGTSGGIAGMTRSVTVTGGSGGVGTPRRAVGTPGRRDISTASAPAGKGY